ncbi:hypothetical protein MP638_006863 [Amoeboaphelidium occidentale]|nr:hypothetical protein MP638_006863 [Amoeboaphelidium occidentale]
MDKVYMKNQNHKKKGTGMVNGKKKLCGGLKKCTNHLADKSDEKSDSGNKRIAKDENKGMKRQKIDNMQGEDQSRSSHGSRENNMQY